MIKKSRGEYIGSIINQSLLLLFMAIAAFPFLNVIAISLSSESAVISGKVWLFPVEPGIETFNIVLKLSPILSALKNTVIVTLLGSLINLVFTTLAAYPLSKPRLRGRKAILIFITFTMLFRAGMIPNYLLVKGLGLVDSYWALWLPTAISVFNMIVLTTFFRQLPDSLEESAMIEGANDAVILVRIAIPLSTAALATIGLYYAVYHWNSYMNVLIYIISSSKFTLQVRLRQLLLDSSVMASITNMVQQTNDTQEMSPESVKAASIVIATVPVLLFYPFLQKYFVKGIYLGSIKG